MMSDYLNNHSTMQKERLGNEKNNPVHVHLCNSYALYAIINPAVLS
jgi:hypothetical protein